MSNPPTPKREPFSTPPTFPVRPRRSNRARFALALRVLCASATVLAVLVLLAWLTMMRMPGQSHSGALPALSPFEARLQQQLAIDVKKLADEIGPRNLQNYPRLLEAARFIEASFSEAGLSVTRHEFLVRDRLVSNIIAEIPGTEHPDEIAIIGAHYDTDELSATPGADDNGSGVAALLALGRAFHDKTLDKTVRLVAFVNEEEPYYHTDKMGSYAYARDCRRRGEQIVGMLALEMLGTFDDRRHSQHYPLPLNLLYPDRANFLAFVSDFNSKAWTHQIISTFRKTTAFPSEGATTFSFIEGVDYSDHWSFWQIGVPAVMVTDTAFFRTEHYHKTTDTPDRLDYPSMARVVAGLARVIEELFGPSAPKPIPQPRDDAVPAPSPKKDKGPRIS